MGFFTELGQQIDGMASLAASRGGLDKDEAAAIATYLENGTPVLDVMDGGTIDPLDGEIAKGGSSLVSDGAWVWRADLPYFVRKYRPALPFDFVAHASMDQPLPAALVLSRLDEVLEAGGWPRRR